MPKTLLTLLFLLLPLCLCAQGSVTVYQGSDIDNVLQAKRKKQEQQAKQAETKPAKPAAPAKTEAAQAEKPAEETAPETKHTKLVQKRVLVEISEDETKLANGGFRIQVFSGGNTRDARQEAERAGHKVKAAFPELPVYVHFYTPRWGCRVGNFRTYQAANQMLRKIKKLGFPQAIVLRKPGQLGERKKH